MHEFENLVLDKLKAREVISNKSLAQEVDNSTYGERLSDKIAVFGGSWTFIISFGSFLLLWILINVLMGSKGFDVYPFIFLNLILSTIAALQAPVIMMSQNRQDVKDRERAKTAFMVDLKCELEIRTLHEKIDHLMIYQQQEMFEMQKKQNDLLLEIMESVKK